MRRRTLLLALNPLTAIALLPLLTVNDAGDVWVIYVVSAAYGVSFMLLSAGQSALLVTIVPFELLGTANATCRPSAKACGSSRRWPVPACTRLRAAARWHCSTPRRSSPRRSRCSH